MKYMKQLCIIMAVAFAGEVLKALLPFPIPASIYGLVLMLVLLISKVLPLSAVEETADFLVSIMPVMFIPAAVGLLDAWVDLKPVLVPVTAIMVLTTVIVMVVTGRLTQFFMGLQHRREGK
ncbi:MAG: CidA/LrgA family protein [Clostridia bacterium]|nr:CidA/LrgA family protein [Clostridia bacterium]MBQ3091223.1 CidA/LrgA family protein [Clostridia bacterium]